MIISHKYKFIFLHVPKTGGTSINKAFNQLLDLKLVSDNNVEEIIKKNCDKVFVSDLKHISAKEVEYLVGKEIWNSYFKFAFVRNPFDRMVSNYFYAISAKGKIEGEHLIKTREKMLENGSFKNYVLNLQKEDCFKIGPQIDLISDNFGKVINFVGKYENLQEDFKKVLEKIGLPNIILPYTNKTEHDDYKKYYDQETKRILGLVYKNDLEKFHYNFDGDSSLCNENNLEKFQNKTGIKVKISHIVNPVKVGPESDLFLAQPITFETMRIAKRNAGDDLDIELLSTQYSEDEGIVPNHFKKTTNLERTVLDLKEFEKKRKLPILRDILEKAFKESDADFIIYTNVDIALMPFFYDTVKSIINQGYDAFVINKRIISSKYSKTEEIPMMYAEFGMPHCGWDCFVFKKELFKKFYTTNVCIGMPNVDYAFIANLVAFSDKFGMFEDLHATFHIGDEMQTKIEKYKDYHKHNRDEVVLIYNKLRDNGFFEKRPLLKDLWLQYNGKKRLYHKLWGQEQNQIKDLGLKNMDEAAYFFNKKLADKNNENGHSLEKKASILDYGISFELTRKKIAFVDMSWRQKTKSSNFFIEILKEKYDVDVFWDKRWKKEEVIDTALINKGNYHTVIFWQVIPKIQEIDNLKCKNIILVPMYDAVWQSFYKDEIWKTYKNYRFISFSKNLHDRLLNLGIDSFYLKYYIKPHKLLESVKNNGKLRGFFWQRKDEINFNLIKKILGENIFDKFYFHNSPDPDLRDKSVLKLSKDDIARYNIKLTNWFANKEDYLKIIEDTDIYFAPRLREGIGLSFIEAMCMGKCVVAPDCPTMNEYITDGVNGFLYNVNDPKPIDFSNIEKIKKNVLELCNEGYKKWIASKYFIFNFIEKNKEFVSIKNNKKDDCLSLIERVRCLKNRIIEK